jgi:hypothetical protein
MTGKERSVHDSRKISLLRLGNSLFMRIFSLLIFIGNSRRSSCSTAGSCYEADAWTSEIAKFPVKFPVSREFIRRRVRSALRRQPALKLLSSLCKQLDSRQIFGERLEMELLMLGPESN